MQKLLAAYRLENTLKNAKALQAYEAKHPFASCLLTAEDGVLLNFACIHAHLGKKLGEVEEGAI